MEDMEVVFYNITNEEYNELRILIDGYNVVLKSLFNKDSANKLKLIKDKVKLENELLEKVSDEKIIGVLSENEYEIIDKKFKDKYLGKNLLTLEELEELYLEIEENSIKNCEKLKIIAKKALKNRTKAFFWIR